MLGVGHQAEHVALAVADARDVVDRAVRVVFVTQEDLVEVEQLRVELVVRVPAPFSVLDGDRQGLALHAPRSEGRVCPLDAHAHVATNERERHVRAQRAGEDTRLAEDLEAVADPEHWPALGRETATASIAGAKRAIAPQRR